jgi:hypothetical protein
MGQPVAEAVCRMAAEYYRLGNASMLDPTRSSGYLQNPDAVTEEALEEVFRAFPELIDKWQMLSDDQRSRYGWCLLRPCRSHAHADWVVVTPNGWKEHRFPDGFKAAAFFVKQEVESYRANIGQ